MTESNKRLKTKRNIEAMVRLLEKESFDQITTVELAQESGISRSSFYTHHRDKYDMIEPTNKHSFTNLNTSLTNTKTTSAKRLQKCSISNQGATLCGSSDREWNQRDQTFLRHKLQILLVDSLQERYSHKSLTDIERVYKFCLSDQCLLRVCQMWVSRKKKSPQQMAEFLMKMLR